VNGNNFEFVQGDEIAGYTIIRELGRGNNGVVYLARQNMLDRLVACKILLPETAADPGYAEAFFQEARNAAKLSHPNIVQALDVGNVNGCCYFVMEYVEGEMLETIRIENPARFTPLFMLSIAIQLADALEYAWRSQKMIHGDIKPENIMLKKSSGAAKLADFGVARVAGSQVDDGLMATPLYVAPEIVLGTADADPRSDIYSFGVMLYELFCGNPPFIGTAEELVRKHVSEAPVPVGEAVPGLDWELAAFIDRMIAKSPDERPQSWMEIRDKLQEIFNRLKADSVPAAVPAVEEDKPKREVPQWLKMLLAIGAAVLAVVLIITLFG
jgi:serine/threonine-protein kinase